jgi:hypothetical protein
VLKLTNCKGEYLERSRSGRGALKESAKGLGSFNTHDEALQLFALILADDIAAQRREF